MNSSLYRCQVMHDRLEPKRRRFSYDIFMFYIDLDELEMLDEKFVLFGLNRKNIFSFRDNDHMDFTAAMPNAPGGSVPLKARVLSYLQYHGIDLEGGWVMLLTHLRIFGYVFNPVSFYFCFDKEGAPVAVIPEVGNTFGEMKAYWLGKETLKDGAFFAQRPKLFYVSPFIALDTIFDFHLEVPNEKLNITIDDIQEGRRFFLSSLRGVRKAFSNVTLLWYVIRFPFLTLKIIALIHWQALLIHLRGIDFHRKADNVRFQQEVHHVKVQR